jgi:ankyrin repeat protein
MMMIIIIMMMMMMMLTYYMTMMMDGYYSRSRTCKPLTYVDMTSLSITYVDMTSLVSSTSKRYVILLNDVLLITSDQSSGDWGIIQSSTEKLVLHQVLDLDHLGIRDLHKYNKDENVCSFEVITPEQTLHLLAESEGDKSIWLEEIESAVFCIKSVQPWKNIGWQHEVIRGTMYSNAMYGDIEALKSSIESRLDMLGKSLDVCDESGMTALHWASMFGQLEAVELLVDHGAEIDILNSGMNSPAMLAAAFGRADTVIFLVGRGASVTTGLRNSVDMDCMLMAIMYGHSSTALYDVINLLQHKGVDINQFDSSGATPLQKCAANNIFRPMQALVDCGADVNMKHAVSGLTCLQIACSVPCPDPETVRSLLEKGAHPNWKDAFRRTSFDIVLDQHKVTLPSIDPSIYLYIYPQT